jgi:hypothetical protein
MTSKVSGFTLFLVALFCLFQGICAAQNSDSAPDSYILMQTGLNVNGDVNSLGLRNSIEYKTKVNDKVLKGFFFEHSTNIGLLIDGSYDKPINWYCMGVDAYYTFATLFDFLSWEVGGGVGFVHLYKGPEKIGLALNLGANLNIKFSERFSMDIAPLVLFPPVSRYYLSTVKLENTGVFRVFQ